MGEALLSGLLRGGAAPDQLLVGEKRADRATRAERAVRRGGAWPTARRPPGPTRCCWSSSRRTWATCSTRSRPRCGPARSWSRSRPASPPPSSSRACPTASPVVRVMPNTPALVDEGMAAISPGSHCDDEHLAEAEALLASTGKVVRVARAAAGRGDGDQRLRSGVPLLRRRGDDRGRRPPRAAAHHRHRARRADRRRLGEAAARDRRAPRPCCASSVTSPGGTTAAAVRAARGPQGAGRVPRPRWRRRATARASWPRDAEPGSVAGPRRIGRLRPACVVFDASLTGYDFGPAHPMNPVRVDLTMRLAGELGVLRPATRGGLPMRPRRRDRRRPADRARRPS